MKRIKDIKWHEENTFEQDFLYYRKNCKNRITVLDRMTGFGYRDIETGFKDKKGRFWLASGSFDIRNYPDLTIKAAIKLIKENANNNYGEYCNWKEKRKRGLVHEN